MGGGVGGEGGRGDVGVMEREGDRGDGGGSHNWIEGGMGVGGE